MHDVESFVEWHVGRLGESLCQGFLTGKELIFVTRNLLRHLDFLNKDAVALVNPYCLRIVNVVNDEIALST